MMRTDFIVGDEVIVCYGGRCGFQGIVTRVLTCFLWVQGADDHVVSVKKCSVALIVEGDSDEESDIAVGPRVPMPNIVPDDDSDATE
jgi:ribosomal protein L24